MADNPGGPGGDNPCSPRAEAKPGSGEAMIPLVAVLARQVIHKAVEKRAAQAFSSHVKQPKAALLMPNHLELERVELTPAEAHREPAQALFRRLQQSFDEGNRAFKRLKEDRTQSASPSQLAEMRVQVDRCNDEVERLSLSVEQAMAALKAAHGA